jgi:hypothetical protein
MLRIVLTYGPALIFSLLRIPAYQEANGMIWTDAIVAGALGLLGGYAYKWIERKRTKKEAEEGEV